MDNNAHAHFVIEDRSHLAILKKEIHSLSIAAGFTGRKLGEIDIIVAELSSNLYKHAQQGELLVKVIGQHLPEGIELISIDQGPGIPDPDIMLKDGFSTTKTSGNGLGAIKRLSDSFNIYSLPGWGTIILSRLYTGNGFKKKDNNEIQVGAIVVPMRGELFCGDGFYEKKISGIFQLLVADGLGHGAEAHYSVSMAIEAFKKNIESSPVDILRFIHSNIKKTRGVVGTVISYDIQQKLLRMAGIGNISNRFCGSINKSSLCYNGIVGSNIPNTMSDQQLIMEMPQLVVLCSDGIKSGWDYQKYPKILKHDVAILAAAIYKDYSRKKDDASVVVVRLK